MGQGGCSRQRAILDCFLHAMVAANAPQARGQPTAMTASHPGVVQGAVPQDPSTLWSAGSAVPDSMVTVTDVLASRPRTTSQQTSNDDNDDAMPQTVTVQSVQIAALRDGTAQMRGVGLGGKSTLPMQMHSMQALAWILSSEHLPYT